MQTRRRFLAQSAAASAALLLAPRSLRASDSRIDIRLDEPIKTLGDFSVPIRLHPEVTAQLKVSVARE